MLESSSKCYVHIVGKRISGDRLDILKICLFEDEKPAPIKYGPKALATYGVESETVGKLGAHLSMLGFGRVKNQIMHKLNFRGPDPGISIHSGKEVWISTFSIERADFDSWAKVTFSQLSEEQQEEERRKQRAQQESQERLQQIVMPQRGMPPQQGGPRLGR
jgi:hypothetical protein